MHVINRDRLRFMVSSKNPLSQRSHVTLEEIASAPLIFPRMATRARCSINFSARIVPACRSPWNFPASHDQDLRRRRRRHSIISESFARDQVKTGK